MESSLRRATGADLAALTSLMQAFYAEEGYAFDAAVAARALAELAADPSLGLLWVISAADAPVGYAALTFGFSLEYGGRDAFVDDLFLQPAFRGRGLGTRALHAIEAECRALGVRALHLEVERFNQAGQALYRRHGFRDNARQLLTLRLAAGSESAAQAAARAPSAEPPGRGASR